MAFSGSQTTRLGMYGGARGLYGSFSGKAAAEVTAVIRIINLQGNTGSLNPFVGAKGKVSSLLGKAGRIDDLQGQWR